MIFIGNPDVDSLSVVSNCNCNYILFTKLPWPGDSEGTFRSSSQAATPAHLSTTHGGGSTLSLFVKRQAKKL